MNNQQPSPLVPQGVPLDPKHSGRARVKIAILFVLIVHGIGLMALLIQGCRREEVPPAQTVVTNDMTAPAMDTTAPPVEPATAPTLSNAAVAEPVAPEPVTPTPLPTAPPPQVTPEPTTSEYKIVQNDTFTSIAKRFGVSVKAIVDANPNVNPARLQIGQKIVIPAPAAAPVVDAGTAAPMNNGGEQVYTVKSGDNLTKIGGQFGVSAKAIRNANNLQTDRITVGQKLKIPAKAQ
jgi:LysM repeat protein